MVSFNNLFTLLASAVALSASAVQAVSVADLPIFFFHGITESAANSVNIAANLTAEGRTFTPLSFCSSTCSVSALTTQIPLALAQIRGIIANDTATYKNGYIVMGHSQGAVIARTMIQNWDEHKVQLFISIAGTQNGIFYGPQAADTIPLIAFLTYFAPVVLPTSLFNVSSYSKADRRGKIQYDLTKLYETVPSLMDKLAYADRWRSPDQDNWLDYNTVMPELNNVNPCDDTECEQAKAMRRANFLRIQQSHYLISPRDGIESPWQSCLFGQYNFVSNSSEILTDFENLEIIAMENTIEYQNDTYGLKTAYEAGRVHLHELPDVVHECWLKDTYFFDNATELCSFSEVFGAYIYPLLLSTDEVVTSGSSSSRSTAASDSSSTITMCPDTE